MKKIIMASILVATTSLFGLGTQSGTEISNTATLSFTAGGVSQPDVNSTTDTFKVDKKIDMVLSISNPDHVPGALGQHNVITTFSFKNEGNSNERFNFHVKNLDGGGSDNTDTVDDDTQDVTDLIISCDYKDENNEDKTATSANAGDDILIFTQVDSSATCTVSATLPTGVADKSVMNVELNATAYKSDTEAEVETSGSDNQNDVDVVFADGVVDQTHSSDKNTLGGNANDDNASSADSAGDGSEVAINGYIIKTPVLSAEKTSCVIKDPVNGESSDAKRIPGAIIRYLFDIKNTGTGDVSDLNITDTIDDNLLTDNTKDSATKDENQTSCNSCISGSTNGISDDTTVDSTNNKVTIEHINVENGDKHTCVYIETEVK